MSRATSASDYCSKFDRPYSLTTRTALISGASSGLGAHFAELFASAGANVVLGARRIERVQEIAERITDNGGKAIAVLLDVRDEGSIADAYSAGEEAFGTINSIVANAGVVVSGSSLTVSSDDVRTVLDTNLLGVYLVVREGAKRLIASGSAEREDGRVVIIGSITAEMTGQGDAAYAASKAAVAHLSRQFAREWVCEGVNVNVIQPGYIHTELNNNWFETERAQALVSNFHRKRIGEMTALDDMMLYLCSDRAQYVTGSTVTIDDGQSL